MKKIGAWIEDFDYVKPAGGSGTLYYTVRTNFADKDDLPRSREQVKVSVLGINLPRPTIDPIPGGPLTPGSPTR